MKKNTIERELLRNKRKRGQGSFRRKTEKTEEETKKEPGGREGENENKSFPSGRLCFNSVKTESGQGQRRILWWHAHVLWLRATAYGAFVIMPKPGTPFPFPQPAREFEILLGERWNNDIEEIEKQGNTMVLPLNMSDAHAINGKILHGH